MTRRNSSNSQIEKRSYSYDKYGRVRLETDARNGATTFDYDDADQLTSVLTPAPDALSAAQTTTYYYNNMGWLSGQRLADGTGLTNFYTDRGELYQSYGSQSYPTEYSYDAQGRLKTLKTWQNFAGNSGTATTTWSYDQYRGFPTGKTYQGGVGHTYSYTTAGRPSVRTWARGVTTTYGYDNAGALSSIDYSDSTPDVSRTFYRNGRTKDITQNSITTTLNYTAGWMLSSESHSGGTLNGLGVTHSYDSYRRKSGVSATGYGGTLNNYTYDTAGRLATIGDGTNVATYAYLANSRLPSQILFKQVSSTRLTTAKAYDFLDRVSTMLSTPSGTNMAATSFANFYNDLNQRTRETSSDGSGWNYGYDSIGQLASAKKSWNDGVPVEGQQFEYVYDNIGNRTSIKEGGDQYGQNLRSASYTANTLNQYTTRSVPDKINIIGHSTSGSTVQVNSSNADYRRGPYFREELGVSNSGTNVIWQSVSVTASPDTIPGNILVPGATQNFYYDQDGNLTNDYTQTYIYNGANQLIEIRPLTNSPAASKKWLTFTYDYAGRRIQKTAKTWNTTSSAWDTTVNNRFLYDGWNLIAELNATNNALIRGYIWGADISGTLHGAGGVGGLVGIIDPVNGNHFAVHDAKGNVVALVSASTGAYTAQYEYDPYGKLIRATGTMANKNPFRFSGKYEDTEVGLIYYPYRYYNPSLGRWQNRDPIEEWGGINIYNFVGNSPANFVDPFGLADGTDPRIIFDFLYPPQTPIQPLVPLTTIVHPPIMESLFPTPPPPPPAVIRAAPRDPNMSSALIIGGQGSVLDEKFRMANAENILTTIPFEMMGNTIIRVGERVYRITANFSQCILNSAKKIVNLADDACFLAGTEIETAEGPKLIEDIQEGEYVWSQNAQSGEQALRPVLHTFVHTADSVLNITVGNEVIQTTDIHPFWVTGKGWVKGADLKVGDILLKIDAETLPIQKLDRTYGHFTVYNLEVDDFHTYFVSHEQILVHNKAAPYGFTSRGKGVYGYNDVPPFRRVTNPKHHPKSVSPEPQNVDELFRRAIWDENGVGWARDPDGIIHRFSAPRNGEVHWNGSTSGIDPILGNEIPNEILKALQ